jgi:hypothetical protein
MVTDEPVVPCLSNKKYITLVIRLLVDQTGEIWQGTILDLYERPVGQFQDPVDLSPLIVTWLAQQAGGVDIRID